MTGPRDDVLALAGSGPAGAALCASAEGVVRHRYADVEPGSDRFYELVIRQVTAWREEASDK